MASLLVPVRAIPSGTYTSLKVSVPDGATRASLGILRSSWPVVGTVLMEAAILGSDDGTVWRDVLRMFVNGLPDYTADGILNTSYITTSSLIWPEAIYIRASLMVEQALNVGFLLEVV